MELNVDTHMMFKAHVGIAIAMCIIGALLMLQVTLSFIGVLMCGNCCSGERAVGLFAYIFTMIGEHWNHITKSHNLCGISYRLCIKCYVTLVMSEKVWKVTLTES